MLHRYRDAILAIVAILLAVIYFAVSEPVEGAELSASVSSKHEVQGSPICQPFDDVVSSLENEDVIYHIGLLESGKLFIAFVNQATGQFRIYFGKPNGETCLLEKGGEGWQTINPSEQQA